MAPSQPSKHTVDEIESDEGHNKLRAPKRQETTRSNSLEMARTPPPPSAVNEMAAHERSLPLVGPVSMFPQQGHSMSPTAPGSDSYQHRHHHHYHHPGQNPPPAAATASHLSQSKENMPRDRAQPTGEDGPEARNPPCPPKTQVSLEESYYPRPFTLLSIKEYRPPSPIDWKTLGGGRSSFYVAPSGPLSSSSVERGQRPSQRGSASDALMDYPGESPDRAEPFGRQSHSKQPVDKYRPPTSSLAQSSSQEPRIPELFVHRLDDSLAIPRSSRGFKSRPAAHGSDKTMDDNSTDTDDEPFPPVPRPDARQRTNTSVEQDDRRYSWEAYDDPNAAFATASLRGNPGEGTGRGHSHAPGPPTSLSAMPPTAHFQTTPPSAARRRAATGIATPSRPRANGSGSDSGSPSSRGPRAAASTGLQPAPAAVPQPSSARTRRRRGSPVRLDVKTQTEYLAVQTGNLHRYQSWLTWEQQSQVATASATVNRSGGPLIPKELGPQSTKRLAAAVAARPKTGNIPFVSRSLAAIMDSSSPAGPAEVRTPGRKGKEGEGEGGGGGGGGGGSAGG
ncbi:hypothetical protein B0T17DRAFT_620101 [Bombardia bombarda]|uniref:Uncharacterized protein n=1 Tax=Bombardia bombarda TaxID=252184 RepID=A0AA39WH50_9PEZI|nr:hypothetical protein B0T17DRAFT_620101 [Bombardia bombarda]